MRLSGLFLMVFALSCVSLYIRAEVVTYPCIEFEHTQYDYGVVSLANDTLQTHPFVFTNVGGDTLVIINIATGCGCVQAASSRTIIEPGGCDTIVVKYNPEGQRIGRFRKSITIFCNDPRSFVRLFVTGTVSD